MANIKYTFKAQAELLYEWRTENALTQRQVADALGLESSQHISNVERGVSPLGVKNWKMLCEYFEWDLDVAKNAYLKDTAANWDLV